MGNTSPTVTRGINPRDDEHRTHADVRTDVVEYEGDRTEDEIRSGGSADNTNRTPNTDHQLHHDITDDVDEDWSDTTEVPLLTELCEQN